MSFSKNIRNSTKTSATRPRAILMFFEKLTRYPNCTRKHPITYTNFLFDIFYSCLVSKIYLSSRNRGFIIILAGRTWRRVVVENWDKNRQKMLCQHLGFEETADNKIVTNLLGSNQDIATGDLICYNTIQPSGTSCCIHLQPSKSPLNPTSQIPLVQCKCILDLRVADSKHFGEQRRMHRISYLNYNVVCFPELSTMYLVRRDYCVTPGEMTQFGVPKTMHY